MKLHHHSHTHNNSPMTEGKELLSVKASLALFLPEVLSIIFLYLDQYTISRSVRFVCKLWNTVASPQVRVIMLWQRTLGPKYDHDFLLSQLHQVDELRIIYGHRDGIHHNLLKLGQLSEKIASLQSNNRLRISRLVLTHPSSFSSALYPILSSISTLTELHLVKITELQTQLITIMELCPNLKWLDINNHFSNMYTWIKADSSSPDNAASIKEFGIDCLTISKAYINQDDLEAVLRRCPRLTTLKLVEVLERTWEVPPLDRPRFYTAVKNSCPELRCFHLSIITSRMTSEDASAMIQTFIPGIQSPVLEHRLGPASLGLSQTQNQTLDTISVLDKDIRRFLTDIFFAPFYNPDFNKTITRLSIAPSSDSYHPLISDAFHQFLCFAPSLLHLDAPSIPYYAEYFDLTGPTTRDGMYYLRSCGQGRPVSGTKATKWIWACRGLLTLNIKVASLDSKDYASVENSRIMFGYIAKVCPNLKELAIDRLALNLRLEGGLCMLSKLRRLRKLTVLTWTRTDITARDLGWIAKRPLDVMCNTGLPTFEGNSSTPKLSFLDLENIGSVFNLEACLEQLASGEENCWPLLEFLGMCLTLERDGEVLNPDEHLPDIMSRIRPGLNFSCNYGEW